MIAGVEGVDSETVPPGSLETSKWPFVVYFSIAAVSTPLYIAIVVKLFRNRDNRKFTSVFYTLLLSQGFADLFYIFCYTLFFILSYIGTMKDISPFFKWTTANLSYKCLYYSLNVRYVGVTLISLQRYLVICRWRSNWNKEITLMQRLAVVALHWTVSLLVIVPILTIGSIRFGCVCKQMVAIDAVDFQLSTINSEVVVLATFLLCVVFYSMTIQYVYAHRKRERQLKEEIRLCVPVAALVFAFFLIFLYHLIQLIWTIIYHEQHRALRVLEPLFSGFLSFSTPWMLLLFSREIASLFHSNVKVCVSFRKEVTHRRTGESNAY